MDNTVVLKKRKSRNRLFIFLMLLVPLTYFFVFSIYMNVDTFVMSMQSVDRFGNRSFTGFKNFINVFNDFYLDDSYNVLKKALVNSLLFFPVNEFIGLPLSIIFAYFLYKKIWGVGFFRVVFFLPSIISVVVLTMVFQFMFNSSFGPVNQILKTFGLGSLIPAGGWLGTTQTSLPLVFLYCIWSGIGYNIVLIQGAMSRVPYEVIESGTLDGIGVFKELFYVIVPMIFPTVSTMLIMGSTAVFTIFLQPMLLTGMENVNGVKTVALLIVYYTKSGAESLKIYAATIGVIMTLIGVPIVLSFKWMLEKITPSVEY